MRDKPRDKLSFAGFEYFLDAASSGTAGPGRMVTAALIGYYDATLDEARALDADEAMKLFGAVSERLNGDLEVLMDLEKKVAAPSASSPTEQSSPPDGGSDTAS